MVKKNVVKCNGRGRKGVTEGKAQIKMTYKNRKISKKYKIKDTKSNVPNRDGSNLYQYTITRDEKFTKQIQMALTF